jgi:hypothetical protein
MSARDRIEGAAATGRGRRRPWWRRLLATLVPPSPDVGERLARHYAAEVRLARDLAQGAASLEWYPHQRARILDLVEGARARADRVRRALEGLGIPATEPATSTGPSGVSPFELLRAGRSALSSRDEEYLADAHALEREHPRIADLLYDLHRDTAGDLRELTWTLAQVTGGVARMPPEGVAA